MGHGTSSNFWNSGNDGVRITVVDASSGTAVSSPLDFSNRTQKTSLLHFGKVNKLQYLGGAGLSLQSGAAYSCIKPTQSMPTIVSSKGQSNIEAIKRYFCSEYACMMVAQAAGVDYERMIAGEYKLLIEPIAYFTHNGQYYCMTATEAGLYDQMSGGNLRKTMTSLTHKNLPLSMFLEFSDLGISAWTGSTTGKQNNADIISTLGVGIVWFDEAPPEGEIEAPDVEYRVDTDVITSVTLRTDQDLTPDNPASVTFHILGTTYRVNDIVIPAGDSQVVWVKWHTPSTPQTVTITVSVSGAYTAQDTFVAKIVDLNEHIPPDPVATDTNPGYSVPPLPSETQKLTANWGVWSCYWVPVWVWCDHGEDGGHWVDEGYWEYEYTGYSASISGEMSLMPDDIVPTASGKTMKSGYGVKTEVRATLSTDAPTSHITYPQTAFSVFPEFQYQTYLRLLQRSGGQSAKFIFKPNEFSTYDRTVHFTPLWFPDATDYTIYTQVWDTWTPDGMLSINLAVQYSIWFDHPKIHDAVERAKPRLHGLRCIQDQKEGKLLLQDGALLFKPKYAKKYSRTLSQSQILSLSWELGVEDEEPDIDAAPVTLPYKKFGATHPIQLQVTSYLNGNLAIQMVTWESGDPEPWATLTVNLPGQRQKDHAFIDTNADSEFPTWLIRHGLAIPTGRTMQSGFCTYPEYRFRANRLQELDPEGYAGYLKNFERRCSA